MSSALSVRNVTKTYGDDANRVLAVDGVSLDLIPGEVLLIMGPSGSGKTTLLSIMGCILSPSAGEVSVAGSKVTGLHEDRLPDIRKKHIGFVFQSFNLFPSLTAKENIELVLRLKGFPGSGRQAEALRLLDLVGLSKRTENVPADLSGGEKQRVALARALAGDPPIVLADEPTANLDSRTGREVLNLFRQMAEDKNKAIAVVSHDPKAEAIAHRVIFMEDGKISSKESNGSHDSNDSNSRNDSKDR